MIVPRFKVIVLRFIQTDSIVFLYKVININIIKQQQQKRTYKPLEESTNFLPASLSNLCRVCSHCTQLSKVSSPLMKILSPIQPFSNFVQIHIVIIDMNQLNIPWKTTQICEISLRFFSSFFSVVCLEYHVWQPLSLKAMRKYMSTKTYYKSIESAVSRR